MYGVTVSELWNGASGFSQVAVVAAIILALYVITKKDFFLYAAAIIFVLGIVSVDTAQGNPANESIGTLLCFGSAAIFVYQIIDGSSGKIWSIIGFIVGAFLTGAVRLG